MDDTNYRLKRVILKPTARCTANCRGCALRRSYYNSLSERRTLSISEWRTVLHDARSLGAEALVISGGEPTLYDHLHDLIYEASSLGFHVTLNTNGSAIDPQYAEHLIQTGLNGVLISLYSDKPEVHNTIRRNPKLWQQACESIRMYARFKCKYQGFRLRTQLIILRENYRTLDEIVRFHMSLGSDEVAVSYLEGDFERKNILTA